MTPSATRHIPAPNSTGGEYCPDFPETCVCPIDPPHVHLRAHAGVCAHCLEPLVTVPTGTPEGTHLAEADLLAAGAAACPLCRRPVCDTCEDDLHGGELRHCPAQG